MSRLYTHPPALAILQAGLSPLTGTPQDYDPLMHLVGDADFVLLGEASHGTHEFYAERIEITKRLILEKGFNVIALEADWPDTYRINRFIKGVSDDKTPLEALSDFERFPTWMWRNADMKNFVQWLHDYNRDQAPLNYPVGIYGMDLYSMFTSINIILATLQRIDPEVARQAHYQYSCFEHFGEDPQAYGQSVRFGLAPSCEEAVVQELVFLRQKIAEYLKMDGPKLAEDLFFLEQNARLVKNAEAYYRSMFMGRDVSWNLRDRHMVETLEELTAFLKSRHPGFTPPVKTVVWAHNSHLGDARATELGQGGELNVGQLVREKYGSKAVLIGFTTYHGTVTAASHWDGPTHIMKVQPAVEGSYEYYFHQLKVPRFWMNLRQKEFLSHELQGPLLERAIGVIYRPHTERISHYVYAELSKQFDGIVHIDRTTAVRPLNWFINEETGDLPETYPTGL